MSARLQHIKDQIMSSNQILADVNPEESEALDHLHLLVTDTQGVMAHVFPFFLKSKISFFVFLAFRARLLSWAPTLQILNLFPCSAMSALLPSPLTTHVLNTGQGVPAAGMSITLYVLDPATSAWKHLTTGTTNSDGRCPGLVTREAFCPATYKMRFETAQYWERLGETCFYPYVEIVFTITDASQKFHIPLLLSRFSYSTYRGS